MRDGSQGGALFATAHDGSTFDFDGRFGTEEVDRLLEWCAARKASEVTIQSDQPVIVDVGGALVRITKRPLAHPEVQELAVYLYGGGNASAELASGKDLDFAHEFRGRDGRGKRFRVNCTSIRLPQGSGIEISIRTLADVPPTLDALDVEPEIVANVRPKDGLVLATGPTGSGKSTLLAAVVRHLLERPDGNEKILEYSSPIEYVYDGIARPSSIIAQSEIPKHIKPGVAADGRSLDNAFALAVRNALRRKPSVIVIGEARDSETIKAVITAALTGHAVFSTMHTIGVAETIRRTMVAFPAAERHGVAVDMMEALRLAVTQVLLPRSGGGKVACREFMVFTPEVRARFLKAEIDAWPSLARALLADRAAPGRSMTESADALLGRGLISQATFDYVAMRAAAEGREG